MQSQSNHNRLTIRSQKWDGALFCGSVPPMIVAMYTEKRYAFTSISVALVNCKGRIILFHHAEYQHEAPVGVLLMAYGAPAEPAQVEAYYTHIRHGHPPSSALLVELQARYQAIGGVSPLLKRSLMVSKRLLTRMRLAAFGRSWE